MLRCFILLRVPCSVSNGGHNWYVAQHAAGLRCVFCRILSLLFSASPPSSKGRGPSGHAVINTPLPFPAVRVTVLRPAVTRC
jgi:hypothetical protein